MQHHASHANTILFHPPQPWIRIPQGAQLFGTTLGTNSADDLSMGAGGESFPGQAAKTFGRLWEVRSNGVWFFSVAYWGSNNGLAASSKHIHERYSSADP
eukprot:364930-Chlamydomonas_euryale.AAC.31